MGIDWLPRQTKTQEIEKKLCLLHNVEYAFLVGNGSTALRLALSALGLTDKRIAFGNSVCPHVPMAVIHSGNIPLFCDVNLHNCCVEQNNLMDLASAPQALIFVHAYGNFGNLKDFNLHDLGLDIPVIEDCALAQGAPGLARGICKSSDVGILSFGDGKVINISHGGAVLTNDRLIAKELAKMVQKLNTQKDTSKQKLNKLNRYHTELYNQGFLRGDYRLSDRFAPRVMQVKEDILCSFDPNYADFLQSKLIELERLVDGRLENFNEFYHRLKPYRSEHLKIAPPVENSVPWRFNFFIRNRNGLLNELIQKNFRASSWHPPVDRFFVNRVSCSVDTPVSDWLGDFLMNFWIDETVNNDYINQCVDFVGRHIEKLESDVCDADIGFMGP